jgi:predicted flavoprotein YhiN
MAAEVLRRRRVAVTVYERMPTPGRKLLIAGRGGLNLTHSEPFDRFVSRYGGASGQARPHPGSISAERPHHLGGGLEPEIFVGSSGRVFPKAKASPCCGLGLRASPRKA